MPIAAPPHVQAANDLTARWCARSGGGEFVLSGAGVWPLLAILAAAARGRARDELCDAVGLPAQRSHEAALRVLELFAASPDLSAALGVWARADLPLRESWRSSLPEGTVATLTGQDALDTWAREHTAGRIPRFPLAVTPDTPLVLATALAATTKWRTPFRDSVLAPEHGPWAGRRLSGLTRTVTDVDDVGVLAASTPVTRVVVTGTAGTDVHLLLGSADPGEVLGTGIRALTGATPPPTGLAAPDGPGLTRREIVGYSQTDTLRVELPPFAVRSEHDLLAEPELFGLAAATDAEFGHFPLISSLPLAVGEGAQHVLASFDRDGFEAAVVTAFAMRAGSAAPPPPPRRTTTLLEARFDRPFGFLLVHRLSGLAVVAGWVADPAEHEDGAHLPLASPGR